MGLGVALGLAFGVTGLRDNNGLTMAEGASALREPLVNAGKGDPAGVRLTWCSWWRLLSSSSLGCSRWHSSLPWHKVGVGQASADRRVLRLAQRPGEGVISGDDSGDADGAPRTRVRGVHGAGGDRTSSLGTAAETTEVRRPGLDVGVAETWLASSSATSRIASSDAVGATPRRVRGARVVAGASTVR